MAFSWIKQPSNFRPTTRMPQFFGHLEHLENVKKEFTITGADGKPIEVTDADYTARFEDIEVRALAQFLLASSQPFEYLDRPAGVTEAAAASAANGCSSRAAAWRATRTRISPGSPRRRVRICRAWPRSLIPARDNAGSIAGCVSRIVITRER